MQTPRECYDMAEQCEQQATIVKNDHARALLLEVAGKWRRLGDAMTADKPSNPRAARPSAGDGRSS
jgi:hypothetical protein